MNLTVTQLDATNGVLTVGTGIATITVAVPGSISGPTGPQGAIGPVGPTGPAGPAGTGATYTFTQSNPASVWTIDHNTGRFPSVVVVDSAGTVVEGDVAYPSSNTISLSFAGAFAGTAYLN